MKAAAEAKPKRTPRTRLHELWANGSIDGMYTLSSLDRFRIDLEAAARRLGRL